MTGKEIVALVERVMQLPPGVVQDTKNRTHEVSLARHLACFVIRQHCRLSFRRIGLLFNSQDHKLAANAYQRISDNLRDRRAETQRWLDQIYAAHPIFRSGN